MFGIKIKRVNSDYTVRRSGSGEIIATVRVTTAEHNNVRAVKREQIAERARKGVSNDDIAHQLGVSRGTVGATISWLRSRGIEIPDDSVRVSRLSQLVPKSYIAKSQVTKPHAMLQSFVARYEMAEKRLPKFRDDICPIDAGIFGRLVDHECEHGYLPGDGHCNCFIVPATVAV